MSEYHTGQLQRATSSMLWGDIWSEPYKFEIINSNLVQHIGGTTQKYPIRDAGVTLTPNEANPQELVFVVNNAKIRLKEPSGNKVLLQTWKKKLDNAKASIKGPPKGSVRLDKLGPGYGSTTGGYMAVSTEEDEVGAELRGPQGLWFVCLAHQPQTSKQGAAADSSKEAVPVWEKLLECYTDASYKDRGASPDWEQCLGWSAQFEEKEAAKLAKMREKNPDAKITPETIMMLEPEFNMLEKQKTKDYHLSILLYPYHQIASFSICDANDFNQTDEKLKFARTVLSEFLQKYPNRSEWSPSRCFKFKSTLHDRLMENKDRQFMSEHGRKVRQTLLDQQKVKDKGRDAHLASMSRGKQIESGLVNSRIQRISLKHMARSSRTCSGGKI